MSLVTGDTAERDMLVELHAKAGGVLMGLLRRLRGLLGTSTRPTLNLLLLLNCVMY